MTIRRPAVAGTFYPADAETLRRDLSKHLTKESRERAIAAIVPHAGYTYSGRVAGAVYSKVEIPATVVILCFNHRGYGAEIAVFAEGAWRTPLGDVPVGRTTQVDFDLANSGNRDTTAMLSVMAGTTPPFTISPTTMAVVTPTALKPITVICAPTAPGTFTTQIVAQAMDTFLSMPITINATTAMRSSSEKPISNIGR